MRYTGMYYRVLSDVPDRANQVGEAVELDGGIGKRWEICLYIEMPGVSRTGRTPATLLPSRVRAPLCFMMEEVALLTPEEESVWRLTGKLP